MSVPDPDEDYRYQALMWWLLRDESGEYPDLLRHMLTTTDANAFDESWKTFEDLAVAQFGRPTKCSTCGKARRFVRVCSNPEFAIWECPQCHELRAAFGESDWRPFDRFPETAYPSSGVDRDRRYDAIKNWLHDPELDDAQFRLVLQFWFLEASQFEEVWANFEQYAREAFPAPSNCAECGEAGFQFWRLVGMEKGAVWRCNRCGMTESIDEWTRAAAALIEGGISKLDVDRMRVAAIEEGLSATAFMAAAKRLVEEKSAQLILPPPETCFKCGESLWEFDSLSPNHKAAKWKCGYCGRTELITTVDSSSPAERAREAIPKDVQREVWRRDGGKCQRCGSRENLEFDHIIAVARGGSSTARNIQLLCAICNGIKSDQEPGAI